MSVSKFVSAASMAALIFLAGFGPRSALSSATGSPPPASASPSPVTLQSHGRQAVERGVAASRVNEFRSVSPSAVLIAASPAPQQANTTGQTGQQRNQPLIDAVEQAYRAGLTNYHAGHLEAARANFDYAVDQMLNSGFDLKNDPQLSAEFDHIVDAINTIEMDALKQGNGFAPRTEPAPVDVANDVTFAVDPTIKAQAQAELKTTQSDLPLVLNDAVAGYINYFTNTRIGHNTLVNSLTRASRYKQMIQRVLTEEGVPQDLIYQAVAESGFQPQIRNGRSGAGGMWQFMPGDAHAPPRSAWYDQRFDPEKSTRAYAKYIKFLHNQLGDWYLAMAAYDWGAGNVQRAVQRTGYADFWELYRRNSLPQETKNYVPIILAATIMAKNPKQYGLDSVVMDAPLLTDIVTTTYTVDLRLVSDIVQAPVQEIVALNPSLLRMATPPDDSFDLHLPPGTKDLFTRRIEEIPVERRKSWRFHKVVAGETLRDIARGYRVSATELAFVNQLGDATDLSNTDALVVPVAAVATSSASRSTRYVAKRGDTLITISDRFNVSVDQLRSWNHLKGTALAPGRSLYVSEPARIASPRGHRRSASASHTASRSSTKSASAKSAHGRASGTRAVPAAKKSSLAHSATKSSMGRKRNSSKP